MAIDILKIFRNYDFRGNKIINARVDKTAAENNEIVNKKTLDDSQTYDTTIVNENEVPFNYTWLGSLKGKTFKQILDAFFFPNASETYSNPTSSLTSIQVLNTPMYNIEGGKYYVFGDIPTNITVGINIINNDRLPITNITNSEIIVEYPSGLIVNYPCDITDNTKADILANFNAVFVDEIKIYYSRKFQPATIKLDNYGNPILVPEFQAPYTLKTDITSDVLSSLIINDIPLIGSFTANNVGTVIAPTTITELFQEYLYNNAVIINSGIPCIHNILIPKSIFDNSEKYNFPVYIDIYDNSNIIIKRKILTTKQLSENSNGFVVSYNIVTNQYESNRNQSHNNYVVCQIDFGTYDFDGKAVVNFIDVIKGNVAETDKITVFIDRPLNLGITRLNHKLNSTYVFAVYRIYNVTNNPTIPLVKNIPLEIEIVDKNNIDIKSSLSITGGDIIVETKM